jgi:ferri-bacillibactin esterase
VGHVDEFLKTIESEVKLRAAALAPIDRANQAPVGHSFGVLAALHALFVEPNAFRAFIIASISAWPALARGIPFAFSTTQ